MIVNIDYIYVPKAEINEGPTAGKITKAALYFTKEYLFVLPIESLEVLYAGMKGDYDNLSDYVKELNKKIPDLNTESFHKLLLSFLDEKRICRIADLENFSILVGFWIFGSIQIRKKGGQLQAFNVQPSALREEIKKFYGL